MTIKELQWALQSLKCSPALNKDCEEAIRFTQQLLNNFMQIVNLNHPVDVLQWSHDVSELNEYAMALREEVGLRRENARLLEAAPELLEALKESLPVLEASYLDWAKPHGVLHRPDMAINSENENIIFNVTEKVKEVIFKATGVEQ